MIKYGIERNLIVQIINSGRSDCLTSCDLVSWGTAIYHLPGYLFHHVHWQKEDVIGG